MKISNEWGRELGFLGKRLIQNRWSRFQQPLSNNLSFSHKIFSIFSLSLSLKTSDTKRMMRDLKSKESNGLGRSGCRVGYDVLSLFVFFKIYYCSLQNQSTDCVLTSTPVFKFFSVRYSEIFKSFLFGINCINGFQLFIYICC